MNASVPLHRRLFLRLGALAAAALLLPRRLLAAWPEQAFEAKTAESVIDALHPGAAAEADPRVHLDVPVVAENGAIVPVSVSTDIADVTRISLIVEHNPRLLTASFALGPGTVPRIRTRLKFNETSRIIAVVEAGGRVYTGSREVRVLVGGCD